MESELLLNGQELITKQNSIIKDLPIKGLKEFSPNNSWIEKKQIEKKLEEKFNFINTERIEKSNNISVAEWIPNLGKAKVLKKSGKFWETIGHHQDNADWLLPEEVLFLVENCELQLILDNVSASIEDCYALLLHEGLCSFDEYRVYSYLCRAGLRVLRHSPTVTPYEQRMNLGTILQQCRRSPSTSSIKQDDSEVMLIEEFSISSDTPENHVGDNSKKPNIVSCEVIEIEDDIDHNSIVEEVLDSSDDSSDVICISSPSYTSTEHCRLWYPTVNQCLQRSIEKLIDLCNDDFPNDCKKLISNKLDLIRCSKTEVLTLLPSAVNGVTILHSPDSRLLPTNIVPKYSEYKVNLNIRSDYHASNNVKPYYNQMPRMPFATMSNNPPMNPELMTNPLFRKAEEMQAMAMNMIQTASTLMSVLSSQNPNELWNLVDGRSHEIRFYPRFRDFQQQRPYFRFPRRNYRPMRRRYPYDRRGVARYYRRPNEFNYSYNVGTHSAKSFSPEVKVETVVLSDDDDYDTFFKKKSDELSNPKRKRMDCDIISKKVKTECDFDSLIVLEQTDLKEKTLNVAILTESHDTKPSEMIFNKNDNIKDNSCNLMDFIEIDDVNKTLPDISENSTSGKVPTSENNRDNRNVETETSLENNVQDTPITTFDGIENIEYNEENNEQDRNNIVTDEKNVQESSSNSVDEGLDVTEDFYKKNELVSLTENDVVSNRSMNTLEVEVITDNNLHDEITNWKEYKNTDASQLAVEEGDSETIVRFDDCSSYGDVLKALQIFKAINSNKKTNIAKIAYDVYLPGASFKKTLKVLPNFRVIILKSNEELPTPMDLQYLKSEYQDQIPFLFTVVFNETVGFYLYDTVSLPSGFD